MRKSKNASVLQLNIQIRMKSEQYKFKIKLKLIIISERNNVKIINCVNESVMLKVLAA